MWRILANSINKYLELECGDEHIGITFVEILLS